MDQASTFNYVMRSLWDWDTRNDDTPRLAFAIASWVKTHNHINHENALEVLSVMYDREEYRLHFRVYDNPHKEGENDMICDVDFVDGSKVLIDCPNGIGSGVEYRN